tara:strand:+ start:286 stop:483 length:198 start_codon:yes stop_codon:yes gene_type:complete
MFRVKIGFLLVNNPCNDASFFIARSWVWEFIRRPMGVAQEWINRFAGTYAINAQDAKIWIYHRGV